MMRRLLLDTHTLLWWLQDSPQLGKEARAAIAAPSNTVFVSAVTGWEIGIKRGLGKLRAPEELEPIVEAEGFNYLPITFFHGEQAAYLPRYHSDPFDRMLIVQAQAEELEIVTDDAIIPNYGVRVMKASG